MNLISINFGQKTRKKIICKCQLSQMNPERKDSGVMIFAKLIKIHET